MFHKEGHKIILGTLFIVVALFFLVDNFISTYWLRTALMIVVLVFFILNLLNIILFIYFIKEIFQII